MLQFFKFVLATVVGLIVFFVVGLMILGGIGAAFSSSESVTLKDNTVLQLDLNRPIREVTLENPFAEFSGPFFNAPEALGLKDIKKVLLKAAKDDKIKGIYLRAEYPSAGWATLEEMRIALQEFKKSGKFIYAYGETYSEKGYYLASLADVIYLTEIGDFEWNGLSAEYDFFKGTLDKLEIQPVIFKVGEYKSAVEMFSRTNMSEPSRQQTQELLAGINGHYLTNIAGARQLQESRLRDWADSLSIVKANDALQRKLITHVGYYDEFEKALKAKMELKDSEKINFVGVGKYLKAGGPASEGDYKTLVAVVIAEGEIISGKNEQDGVIASGALVKELKRVRDNDKVKAVVLRINSPGGSALASDVIWREVKLTAEKKPVIASMGDVAASGGYYIAMACDTIVAQPNTITGSIGIFGMIPNLERFMRNKLGITFDRVTTNNHADWPTATREMSEFEKNKIQNNVDHGYEVFASKAAEGRKMSIEQLKNVAQGRVWSGIDARKVGLIDSIGGLNEAISLAAGAVQLKEGDYRVRYYPEKKDFMEELINKMTGKSEDEALFEKLGLLAPYWKSFQKLERMQGIQARMPFELEIR